MSGKRPKGSFHACRELMAAADSHATTKNGQGLERFTPCPELLEEGSAFNTLANTGCVSSASDRGINPNALHRLGFMPRKHLHHTGQNSLGTGSGESFTPRTPSPRRQEWDNKGKALGFKNKAEQRSVPETACLWFCVRDAVTSNSAWNARGLGIVTRQGQDKNASPFWLGERSE